LTFGSLLILSHYLKLKNALFDRARKRSRKQNFEKFHSKQQGLSLRGEAGRRTPSLTRIVCADVVQYHKLAIVVPVEIEAKRERTLGNIDPILTSGTINV